MAVLSHHFLTVTASATPISPDSAPEPARPTKVILPKKKAPKWSTGTAPGEYGGPPTTTKLRKYWGGEGEDPLTSDDLIWNKDFMPRMKRLFRDSDSPSLPPLQELPSGFLSLNRAMSLDNMEVDLSKDLAARTEVDAAPQVKPKTLAQNAIKWKPAPTRREQEKWDRATKAATGGSDVMFRELRRPRGDPKVLAAEAREQYYKLKNKLQILTVAIGGIGLVSAYASYTPEITASYGVGLLGSLVYMRMLGNTIDSIAEGARGLLKGAVGQPRLLVPVVLVMVYNRWNGILVPEYGFIHLELIPMLVGFFTYKIATFAQAIEEALTFVQEDASSS